MSRKADPKVIGGFVVGAMGLAVIAILSFGSGNLLAAKRTYILNFEESLMGLNVGAPVLFMGVPVGAVVEIVVRHDTTTQETRTPVYIELETDRFQEIGGAGDLERFAEDLVENRGLRAQLVLQSLITGQLAIEFSFHDNATLPAPTGSGRYPELPTIKSFRKDLVSTIQATPVEKMMIGLHDAIQGINKLVGSPDLERAIINLDTALVKTQELAENLNDQIEPLATSFTDTLNEGRIT